MHHQSSTPRLRVHTPAASDLSDSPVTRLGQIARLVRLRRLITSALDEAPDGYRREIARSLLRVVQGIDAGPAAKGGAP